jgi:hypothetical protein
MGGLMISKNFAGTIFLVSIPILGLFI